METGTVSGSCAAARTVLISSGSQRVSVWRRLGAELQIASVQSDLQTLPRLEQKHTLPPFPPSRAGRGGGGGWSSLLDNLSWGYHMYSASVFTSSTAVQQGTLARVQASPRGPWRQQLNSFQMVPAFRCRDVSKRTNPSTPTAVFLCVFFHFSDPSNIFHESPAGFGHLESFVFGHNRNTHADCGDFF